MAAPAGARASGVPMPDMRDGVCGLGSGETVTPRAWRNLKPGSWAPMARTASTGHCTLRDFEAAASRVPVRDRTARHAHGQYPWTMPHAHAQHRGSAFAAPTRDGDYGRSPYDGRGANGENEASLIRLPLLVRSTERDRGERDRVRDREQIEI